MAAAIGDDKLDHGEPPGWSWGGDSKVHIDDVTDHNPALN